MRRQCDADTDPCAKQRRKSNSGGNANPCTSGHGNTGHNDRDSCDKPHRYRDDASK